MKKEYIINIIYLSVFSLIPFALILVCALNFDSHSEASIVLLPLSILSYLGQILATVLTGVLSKSFRISLFIGLSSFAAYAASFIIFFSRAGWFVIRRLESGYIYGLHPWDDAHTFEVLLHLLLLLFVLIITLIIKKIRINKKSETAFNNII